MSECVHGPGAGQVRPQRPRRGRGRLAALAVAIVLCACGGGSDGTATTPATPTTPESGTTTSGYPVIAPAASYVLTGIASTGAPLLGAVVRAIDGSGLAVGFIDSEGRPLDFIRTSSADGSFRALLATSTPALPLLIQASGADTAGNPVVLHSALIEATAPHVAHVTPASDALVAQVLGATPARVFASGVAAASSMPLLVSTTAVTTASDQVKAILKTSLSDLKVDSATLDLLGHSTFVADKTGLDLVLEGVRFAHVRDAAGRDQMLIANKYVAPGTIEVRLDLAAARAELLKGSSGSAAKAIISNLKAATSPQKATLLTGSTIDELPAAINRLIASGSSAAAFTASPVLASHVYQDGRPQAEVANQLASFAGANLQLSRMQFGSCVDDPIPTKGCGRIAVSALVTDRAGNVVDTFTDTAIYKTTTSPSWVLGGNDRRSDVTVRPAAQASFDAFNRYVAASLMPGVQLAVRGNAIGAFGQLIQVADSATLRVPSGFSVLLRPCGLRDMCIATSATNFPVATGDLRDTLIQRPAPGWVGSTDGAFGARFQATVALGGTRTETFNAYLPAEVDAEPQLARFPVPDQNWPAAPGSSVALSWVQWANANPDQRIVRIRTIVNLPGSNPLIAEQDIDNPLARSHVLAVPAARTAATGWQVVLISADALGRRYHSQFILP